MWDGDSQQLIKPALISPTLLDEGNVTLICCP